MRQNLRDLAEGPIDASEAQQLQRENIEVRHSLLSWQEEYGRLQKQLAETNRLREYYFTEFPCQLIPAVVIAGDSTPYHRSRAVAPAKGAIDGSLVTTRPLLVNRDTALIGPLDVLNRSVLVGQIVSSGAWTARLRTIQDKDFRIDAAVCRNPGNPRTIELDDASHRRVQRPLKWGDPAIPVKLLGRGTDLMATDAVPAYCNIQPGDWVLTRGDGWLPANVGIGTVRRVQPVENQSTQVWLEVEPMADLSDLSDVYIVAPQWRVEQ